MSLGRHFPITQYRPQGEKSACPFQDEISWEPHRALNGCAFARPSSPPPFLLSHPQEGDASGGSRGRGALGSLWWKHSPSGWQSGPLTDSEQHSRPAALKKACSQDLVLSSAGFFPHQSLLSTYRVHSIYWHRGKVGKSREADTWLTFSCHFLTVWPWASGFPSWNLHSFSVRNHSPYLRV